MKKYIMTAMVIISTILHAGNYTRTDHNTVIDHDTDLEWQDLPYSAEDKAASNSETKESNRVRKWINAQSYCDSLGSDWRLATINELKSIVNKNYSSPAMDPIFKSGMPYGFWSSSPSTTVPNTMQGMGFAGGNIHHCGKNKKAKFIRCVHKNAGTTPTPVNNIPKAKAGADQSVMKDDVVILDGSSSSDSDGTITATVWKEGTTVLSRKVSFDKVFSVGTHTIILTVTDNDGAVNSDQITVLVKKTADSESQIPEWVGKDEDTEKKIVHYETVHAESAIELSMDLQADFNDHYDNDIMIIRENDLKNEDCAPKVYVEMKSEGKIRAGYKATGSKCEENINDFVHETIARIIKKDNKKMIVVDTMIKDNLNMGE
jgi:hypothetical protein